MIWVNNIADLDYYNTPQQAPCYCEALAYAADLVLQAQYANQTSNPTVTIEVMSPDGLTVYSDDTAYFQYYFTSFNGVQYCNIRLKSFSPTMCLYKCWILRVTIGNFFQKYTQRYCQAECCDTPRDVTITTVGVDEPVATEAGQQLQVLPTTACGVPLIRIEVTFDCLDNQLSDYYGIPAGQTWGFKKITNIAGKYKQLPREITRNISYNCNLQRSESFIPYKVYTPFREGTFPAWKLRELESMFHARVITVSDFIDTHDFQFDGGSIAKTIGEAVCWNVFQLDATMRTCTIRQTFGCGTGCDVVAQSLTFLVPEQYAGGDFYDENRVLIGGYANLLQWYGSRNFVTGVVDVTPSYNNVYAAFTVTGTGYIPTQFYYDQPTAGNRVFGTNSPDSPAAPCAMPQIGTIIVVPAVCATPTIGTIIVEPLADEVVGINNYENWEVQQLDSRVTLSETYARLDIVSRNDQITAGSDFVTRWYPNEQANSTTQVPKPVTGTAVYIEYATQLYNNTTFSQDATHVTMTNGLTWAIGDQVGVAMNIGAANQVSLINEIVGVISQPGRPATPQLIQVSDDVTITIDTNGNIRWTGPVTSVDSSYAEVEALAVYYNLN